MHLSITIVVIICSDATLAEVCSLISISECRLLTLQITFHIFFFLL